MECTGCKYPDSHIIYTRHNDKDDSIIRRRECLRCGNRFTTEESMREVKKALHDAKLKPNYQSRR